MKPLLLLALLSAPAGAAPTFTKEAGVRVASATFSAYHDTAGAYPLRVYYLRESSAVYSATTADGLAFVEEAGVRLSSETVPLLDVAVSSITGLSVLPLNAGGFRMAYSVVGTTGAFRIYTATSADGFAWANETGTAVDVPGSFVGFPSLVELGSGDWRLYYIQDFNGGDNPGDRRVFGALSSNEGRNFNPGAQMLSGEAGQVAATRRTDNRVRLFYTAPLSGETTRSLVLSGLSADANGNTFADETGLRLSTTSSQGSLSAPLVVRTTETFRWRLYTTYTDATVAPSTGDVYSATSDFPDPQSLNPASTFQDSAGATNITITGEVFSAGATALLRRAGQTDVTGAGPIVTNDNTLAASFAMTGKQLGLWDLVVANATGLSTTLPSAFLVDFKGGSVQTLDNLLRPLQGGRTRIDVSLFTAGRLSVRLYTVRGGLVSTLFDAQAAAGTTTVFWDGRNAGGATVASGVYLLHAAGPKLDSKTKIVVVK